MVIYKKRPILALVVSLSLQWVLLSTIIFSGSVNAKNSQGAQSCVVTDSDKAWIDRTLAAWRFASTKLATINIGPKVNVRLFSANCLLASDNALSLKSEFYWQATAFEKVVPMPGSKDSNDGIPAHVTSFAGVADGTPFFVMALPSVWKTDKVSGEPFSLENLMTAVFVHEAMHVSQNNTYMQQFMNLAERHQLPSDFNDDSIQKRFEPNKQFSASIAKEIDFLFKSASANSIEESRRFAKQALLLIKKRRAHFYRGKDAHLSEVEDVWLTLEGSGQWLGYQWLVAEDGGGYEQSVVHDGFAKRGKWWSQIEGLALIMAVDRLDQGKWKIQAFTDGKKSGIALLIDAIETKKPSNKLELVNREGNPPINSGLNF
jgi:hypothetical protein